MPETTAPHSGAAAAANASGLSGVSLQLAAGTIVLPGDATATITAAEAGATQRAVVRLGPGVLQRGRVLHASKAGSLATDAKRNRVWVDASAGPATRQRRYVASVDDMVVGTVVERHSEEVRLSLNATDTATLSSLAFEGATKKNRPALPVGALVFCRVVRASRNMEPEVSCIEPGSAKSWLGGECLYGELKGGMVVPVSLACAHELARGSPVLKALGARVAFESAVGANGRVWIKAGSVGETMRVCQAVAKADVMGLEEWYKFIGALFASDR